MLLKLVDRLVYGLLGMDPAVRSAQTLHFFIYDLVKIFSLLAVLIFLIGVIRTYLPEKKLKDWMSRGGLFGNLVAALFGAVTPFCSCSSIPIFISFLKAGAPLGVTFSFLVASPLINEYLVILMLGTFGWKITGLYVLLGLVMGVIAGGVIGRLNLEHLLEHDLVDPGREPEHGARRLTLGERLRYGWNEASSIIRKIWIWVMIGVGIGALIHNYVPQESIHSIMEKTGLWSVPIATLLGVPLYGSCSAVVPIAVVLFEKGIPLGTSLAFMMAIAALSLPEAIMLRRVMKLSLIATFFGITTAAIIVSGYLMNAVMTG